MAEIKKILTVFLAFLFTLPLEICAYAENAPDISGKLMEKYSINVVSPEAASEIESLNVQISILQSALNNRSLSRSDAEQINLEINNYKKRVKELGSSSPSEEFLEELILSSMPQAASRMGMDWHPSQLAQSMISMYDTSLSYATTYDGRAQYHLILRHKGADPYLHVVKTDHFYNGISKGSTEAHNWAQETMKFYVEAYMDFIIGQINPFLTLIPYTLLGIAAQPNDSAIYSNQDATVATINTTSTQKFVYVFDNYSNGWYYALSTNYVSCAVTITQAISVNGISYNDSEDYNNIIVYNQYTDAHIDANSAYEASVTGNTCISEVIGYSQSKSREMISCRIHTPTYIIHMS